MIFRSIILLVTFSAEQILAMAPRAPHSDAAALTGIEEAQTIEESSIVTKSNEHNWYVDAVNGDDNSGDGSKKKPFRTVQKVFSINESQATYLNTGDTLYLAAGNYDQEPLSIDVPELSIVGALNENGRPASILGDVEIVANGVTLMNCKFFNAGVTIQNVEGVAIFDSIFFGETETCLSLLGASGNLISRNEFKSSTQNTVFIGSVNGEPSNDNLFFRNYFTHHPDKITERCILVSPAPNKKTDASARNRFVGCAFEELVQGQLGRVIDDFNKFSMVAKHDYSVQFEDCYFKRADRDVPFSEFILIKKKSKVHWSWDELIDDTWVATNYKYTITGGRKKKYPPRVQFVDGNGDGTPLETTLVAGLLISENTIEEQTQPDEIVEVNKVAVEATKESPAVTENVPAGTKNLPAQETIPLLEAMLDQDEWSLLAGDTILDRSDWYVDAAKGDDVNGIGSEVSPFRSIQAILTLNERYPSYVGSGDTVYLAAGRYDLDSMELDIAQLNIKGTLDKYGKPLSILGDVKITASDVTLINCEFEDAELVIQNAERVHVSNNVFSGDTAISLSLLGASNNTISYNEFRSAIYDCVYIYWDPSSRKVSSDNTFLRNYFTHRSNGVTNRIIRVNWSPGNNDSISARNRFVSCAFKETVDGHLTRIIADDSTWWMVVDHKYSVQFEDCYFKRADRMNPFREFVILKGHPDFKWRWDELENDTWFAANTQYCLTGDYNNWSHKPRLRFVDGDRNGLTFEMGYSAGLLPSGNPQEDAEK